MISRDSHIILKVVHQLYDSLALAERSDRFALQKVAVIYEDSGVALFIKLISYGLDSRISEALINCTMNITCEENIYITVFFVAARTIS